ncbi:hypothetical protein Dimus_017573 [Dionaea muscipula]
MVLGLRVLMEDHRINSIVLPVLFVYDANRLDLEPTIDLLINLESYIDDSINNLPEALDMGDIPQHTSSSECSSGRVKHVAGESNKCSDSAYIATPISIMHFGFS